MNQQQVIRQLQQIVSEVQAIMDMMDVLRARQYELVQSINELAQTVSTQSTGMR